MTDSRSGQLSTKSIQILELIAEGRSYSQIVESQTDVSYLDIFNAAAEALRLNKLRPTTRDGLTEVRERHPRAYELWDEDEDGQLAFLLSNGTPIAEIAKSLQRQPSAIRSRIRKLGLGPT
jgi:hypothetical protein